MKWNLLRCVTTNGKNMNEAERDTGEQIYEASKKQLFIALSSADYLQKIFIM